MSNADIFLDVAYRIGKRIVAKALWNDKGCTWEVMTPLRANPAQRQVVATTASGALYQGTAGIALFLIELYHLTDDSKLARAAEGAIRHAIDDGHGHYVNNFGFYGGSVGIAYTAARIGSVLEKPEYYVDAVGVLAPLRNNAATDMSLDLVAGAAGAIPALIELANTLDTDIAMTLAVELGEHLIATANREPMGWSWDAMLGLPRIRNLTGLAHGTAGIGHGLLTLYCATGSGQYRYAAEQAFLYEQQFFVENESNWLDLRHKELVEYQHQQRTDELKALLAAGGTVPPFHPSCMTTWCYGAPGIALSRLYAYRILGYSNYATEARAAIRSTLSSLGDDNANYSLCHGVGGNCEALVYGAEILGDSSLTEVAEECGMRGWERFEKTGEPWPCGTIGGATDPSLLVGEAGIGYFFLRLTRPDTPSVLLVASKQQLAPASVDQESYRELRDEHLRSYFGRTLAVLSRMQGESRPLLVDVKSRATVTESQIVSAYDEIQCRIEAERNPHARDQLRDVFGPEEARYQLSLSPVDFTEFFLASLTRHDPSTADWEHVSVEASPEIRLVESRWEWDGWLADDGEERGAAPAPVSVTYLVHQVGSRVYLRRLNSLSALILRITMKPAPLAQIVSCVQRALETTDSRSTQLIRASVIRQIEQAVQAGIVNCREAFE